MIELDPASTAPPIVRAPPILAVVPTYNFLAILAPPSTRKIPVSPVASLESVVPVRSRTPEVVNEVRVPTEVIAV